MIQIFFLEISIGSVLKPKKQKIEEKQQQQPVVSKPIQHFVWDDDTAAIPYMPYSKNQRFHKSNKQRDSKRNSHCQ